MRILFVRHGQSLANAATMVATPDSPLAEEGLEQARRTGQDLQHEDVSTIVCSPFIRAQQTAEIIAGELGIPLQDIIIIDELHERRMGELEGKPKRHETEVFYRNNPGFGLESGDALIARMTIALEKVRLIAQKAHGTTLVVGHATSGFYMLQIAKGHTRFADFDPFTQMSNAEFTEVELANN